MDWTQRYKWGIITLIIVFLAFNAWLITMSFSQDISLVDEDYYEKDLAYQQTIEELQRTRDLGGAVTVLLNEGNIQIRFPRDWIPELQSGNIQLYRPSDANSDRQMPLSPGMDGIQTIPADQLATGRWIIKIRWLMADKWYRLDTPIFL